MANLKGGNAIVRFLLGHGEKLGMAAVAICAGMLFWSALKQDRLGPEQQPEKLIQLAKQASQHVQEFTWEGLDDEEKLRAEPFRAEAMAQIVSEHFPPSRDPWNRPVLEPMSLRMDPELLAAEDLEVHGDSGLWASADPAVIEQKRLEAMKEQQRLSKEEKESARAREQTVDERGGRGSRDRDIFGGRGGRVQEAAPARNDGPIVVNASSGAMLQGFEEISAKSWVTVVAKVPIEKQYQLYDEALMNSTGYNAVQDIPLYRGYKVERAEVTDEGQGEWEPIASIDERRLEKTIRSYPFDPLELISDRYVHPLLTHPLPPLTLRDWDRRVTHSSIPLASEEMPEGILETEEVEEGDKPLAEDEMFAAGPSVRGESYDLEGRGGRVGSNRRRMDPRGTSMYGRSRGMEAGMGGTMGMEEGRGGGRSYGRGGTSGVYSWDGVTPHVLFRYFDDSVLPGHRYRYRVRLALTDVNHEVSEQYLDKTVAERRHKIKNENLKTFRLTDWSQPSPVASVPLPARIYLVSADPASESTFTDEPEAKILVQAFNGQLPAEIALEKLFLRGSVLNVRDKASVIWVDRADLEQAQINQDFDFRTGITVIDFRGGDRLSNRNRDLTVPARAVLMDPAGWLFLQAELDDREPVGGYQQALKGDTGGMNRFGGRGGRGEFNEGGRGGEEYYEGRGRER